MTIFSENDFNSLALAQDQFQQKRQVLIKLNKISLKYIFSLQIQELY